MAFELDIYRTPPTVDEAINMAAEHLPPGWKIIISIERDGYGVSIEKPDCSESQLDGGDGMRSDIMAGIAKANGIEY